MLIGVRRFAWLALAAVVPLVVTSLEACSEDRPGPMQQKKTTSGAGGGSLFDAGLAGGPPSLDAPGLCGNELHQVVFDAPNLYFVLDRSGSMAAPVAGDTAYDVVRAAMLSLVKHLGALVRVGAAIFPGISLGDTCAPGEEVFAVTQGDPVQPNGTEGPVTTALRFATKVAPSGGTPTSATLEVLLPTLAALPGRTIVLLATDGAPNCNSEASCGLDECQAYLEGYCDPNVNCCLPGGTAGPLNCVDRPATVAAVEAIHALGIDVYVIGIPGSDLYSGVLDAMATAGGTAHSQFPLYVKVDDLATLEPTFAAIAAAAITCEFTLSDPPTDKGLTNVYLDGTVVPYDPANGWTWVGDDRVWLHGDACSLLKTGGAVNVQIVSGCPTELPQ
ncbi:MAG: VWA domain-containing protein [Polyangiaceae bacterium]|nr:VWA domain-containing protein [Polyangiaceae bacterium]